MDAQPEFDREAAERVLRRAVQLSESWSTGTPSDGISERALVEAAEELGVEASVVRQAMGEERTGLLAERRRPVDRVVGRPAVTVSRLVDGNPDQVLERLDAWLRRTGTLRRQRLGVDGAEYRKRSDVVAGVQRTVRSLSGEEDLGRVSRLRVTVRPVDGERSVLALTADLSSERALALAGGSSVAGVGSAASVVGMFEWTGWLWLGVPASLAAGVGILAGRAAGLGDVEVALTGVLDRMSAGEAAPSVLTDVRRRLLRSTTGGKRAERRATRPEPPPAPRRAGGAG